MPAQPQRRFLDLADPEDDSNTWRVDAGFLTSRWQCLWGCGCQGINDDPTPELMQGCCSVGVVLRSEEEATTIAALAETLDPTLFQNAQEAAAHGTVERDGTEWCTRVLDDACIFFNRPGFAGGAGCALHLTALNEAADPLDFKPLTCWKMPIRTERAVNPNGTVSSTLRAWRRDDWGEGGADMAWWCTEAPEAFTASQPVYITLKSELTRLLGEELYTNLANELAGELAGETSEDAI